MKSGEEKANTFGADLALYRKYRSRNLDEVLGQPQVTEILKAGAESDTFSHSYLLVGQRGTGKTSVARILAHLINATAYDEEDFDIIEIDAASHGSVDDARELRDRANLAPLHSRNKVYIIDEVHMLSRQAFDALLKLIEEPPQHLYFILATTELNKVPATILSRVARFTFRPVPREIVAKHLREIADKEKIQIEDDALELIAERGGGSFRDSITLLDQLRNLDGKVSRNEVQQTLGLASSEDIEDIINSSLKGNISKLTEDLREMYAGGSTANELAHQLVVRLTELGTRQPELYLLVNQLLEVVKSSDPQIKLLAILASFAISNNQDDFSQKTPTPSSVKPEPKSISASVELPTQIKPIEQDFSNKAPKTHKKILAATQLDTDQTTEPDSLSGSDAIKSSINRDEFNWDGILQDLDALDEPAALALAKAAEFRVDDSALILYFAKKFQRGKADTKHFREILGKALEKNLGIRPEIIVSSDLAPEDSNAAKVLNIIGGGEILSKEMVDA